MEQIFETTFLKKVLVIDDSETDRYVAKHIIQKCQFASEIIVKESAPRALEYIRSLEGTPDELPQLIFLDIRMPEMDGFGFLDEYSKLPDCVKSNSVIMMLSTSLDPDDHERATKNTYVNRFLNKPLNKEKILMLRQEFFTNNGQKHQS